MTFQCRFCRNGYEIKKSAKAPPPPDGYCTMACAAAAAKKLGWSEHKWKGGSGVSSTYVLKKNKAVGHVEMKEQKEEARELVTVSADEPFSPFGLADRISRGVIRGPIGLSEEEVNAQCAEEIKRKLQETVLQALRLYVIEIERMGGGHAAWQEFKSAENLVDDFASFLQTIKGE